MYQIEGETHGGPQARHMHDTEVWEEEPAPDDQAAGLAPQIKYTALDLAWFYTICTMKPSSLY